MTARPPSKPIPAFVQSLVDQLSEGDPFYAPLSVQAAVEGGYYAGTFKTTHGRYEARGLSSHEAASGGYTILTDDEPIGALHAIKGMEVFCFLGGDPVEMVHIDPNTGVAAERTLGPGLGSPGQPTATIERNVLQATRKHDGPHGFSLYWAVLAPAFNSDDTKVLKRPELLDQFPDLEALILKYTHES